MPTRITCSQVCSWLRAQAVNFERMARDIETTFGMMPEASDRVRPPDLASAGTTLTAVRKLMENGRSLRRATIAEELDVTESRLDRILTEANGFVRGSRGWWSIENGEHNEDLEDLTEGL